MHSYFGLGTFFIHWRRIHSIRRISKMVNVSMLLLMIGCLPKGISSSSVPHDYQNSSSLRAVQSGGLPALHVLRAVQSGGLPALHVAAANNRLDIMEVLLRGNSDINVRSPDGSTVLHTAAASGNLQLISFILQYENALVNPKNNKMFTPLVIAERNGHTDVASLLRTTAGNISSACLIDSAIKGNLDEVRSLILRGADVNGQIDYKLTALHKAARYNFLEVVKFLVEHGADLTIRAEGGQIPLFEAAYYGNLDIVIYLVENGSEINTTGLQGMTPMHAASVLNHPDVVKYLASVGGVM